MEEIMSEKMKWAINTMPHTDDIQLQVMSISEIKKARKFHESFPQYQKTPLRELSNMAAYLGVQKLFVKDESDRFGLNAFKVLGGSFAMAKYIAKQLHKDVSELPYEILISEKIKEEFGQATFFTATDGNHGRGVAWAAKKLGQKAVVFMPKGSTWNRLEHIRKEGANVTIEEVNYDACVRIAAEEARKVPNGVIVQDTAWEGYEEIPTWIMQGYGTMAMEADEQFSETTRSAPTHVIVQAGVGSLAGAIQGYFANRYPLNPPLVIVVEASRAACLYKGAIKGDGEIQIVDGDMPTIMAGLACGEPNTISWDILRNHTKVFLSCPDWVTRKGMRMLAAPVKGDPPITSGESGAVPFGALAAILSDDTYIPLREAIQLNQDSRVLCFSTEGNTDPNRYRNIVWEGLDQ